MKNRFTVKGITKGKSFVKMFNMKISFVENKFKESYSGKVWAENLLIAVLLSVEGEFFRERKSLKSEAEYFIQRSENSSIDSGTGNFRVSQYFIFSFEKYFHDN